MEIKVKEILGEKLITRDQILNLRNYILKQKDIIKLWVRGL